MKKRKTKVKESRLNVYDTGKVKIGLAYQRPLHVEMSRDMERLQAGLLGKGQRITPHWTGDTLMWIVAAGLFSASLYLFIR